ncbi:SLC13 family permease [Fredinandcohnia onubensis]|uniref:SLC13 family permease n=1 Tax=Fredinandcohnia onubensis TaxID=1571209 RepID=UPI000C0BFC09|nr:SLC13 family permease [Fredinandcohnia onubensis]
MITGLEKQIEKRQPLKSGVHSVSKPLVLVVLHVLFLAGIAFIDGLDYRSKIALFAFLSAMTLWVTTKIPAGFVAISLIVFTIILNAGEPSLLYESLSEKVVWLMIGSFIIGEAVKESGLADRVTLMLLNKSKDKGKVLAGVSSILFASAFFIPSTSGRAALSMPIINQLNHEYTKKEQSVLALLAPIIILMSTSATIIGAGSHLIGIGLLETTVHQSISFIQWFIWGLPFALVMTILSFFTVKLLLWPRDELRVLKNTQSIEPSILKKQMNRTEKKTLILMIVLIIGWMTESLHGYDIAFITMVGAILVMTPNYGIINWKQGMKSVSWNLILFVAAAAALGKMLVETGVVKWLEKEMLSFLHLFTVAPEWLIVLVILAVTVTSHLYITSHTTRAIVFIPGLLLFSETIGVNPSTVVFLSLIGINYCVTFPVSSKALLLFYEEEGNSYDARNLLKISAILMPVYILVMMIFYFTYWQWTGLQL